MSPKKKFKSKHCADAVNDMVTVSGTAQVQKCPRNIFASEELVSQPHGMEPRHSGRPGAGSGGRATQLEQIGTVLGVLQVAKSRNLVTDISEGTIINPLALEKSKEKSRKGQGTKKVSSILHQNAC